MAPISKDRTKGEHLKKLEESFNENSIVISGTSGLLPGSHNLVEFADKLYKKENFVKHGKARWNYSHPELSEYYGIIPELNRFDAQFFMVHYRLATCMDAMARKLLEQVYQAIYDAGLSPTELYGTRTAVYVATGLGETEKMCSYNEINFGLLAVNRTMFANRVSYWLNTMGPSLVIDASCCSSMVALEQAAVALNRGDCEYAIVAGAAIMLHPQSCIHYGRLVQLNMDGKTKCYDINADGQARSEAVNVVFMQKLKNAKRVYAVVKHVKSQFTLSADEKFALKFGPYREPSVLAEFLNNFYEEAGISPNKVEYVEGFGPALPDADKSELEAIEKVFCKNRTDQLFVGSVMSNIGYTEAASGLSSLLKVLIAYQRGEIAANIHCENPRQDIAALCDGRMRILTDNKCFNRSYVGINCLSVTGVNSHLLLQGHYKKKDLNKYQSQIPYLVILSGRQESGVQKILDDLKQRPIDPEEVALFQSIHKMRIKYHLSRGFGIYSTDENNKTIALSEKVDYYDDAKAPLWFVYSGMGSQWSGMGAELMKIPIFADAIYRCHKVLESKGIDLIHILTSRDKNIYNNILNSFVGIAAVQIGLTDVLKAIGLVPDKIIGHSVGELGCAYADGCFTAEEMILSAYSRGLVSIETPFIRGSMAAVGIGYKELSYMCPPEIEIACHNGPESSTLSGPADAMKHFVAELTAKGIFAKEVPCSNIAYHSRYISEAGPGLLKYLSKVIHTPKLRSERWMSTSIPQEKWNESAAKYSSAEYHTNNLLNPVLFEETSRLVPPNAVLVEIAPHGLLQAILKRSLPSTCRHIPLTRRGHSDNALLLLEAIGKIYMAGYDVNISALYPKIEFPVSTETRSFSHLIEWAHGENWPICLFEAAERSNASVYKPIITLHDDEYLRGHVIEGRRVLPFASSLVAVWDTLAMSISKPLRELSVQFRDIHLYVQPPLYEDKPLNLNVMLLKGNGRFEVTYEHGLVADGYILAVNPDIPHFTAENKDPMELNSIDFYKLLHERGYQYSGDFRSIESANFSLTRAKIAWKDSWVTFIDGLLQICVMRNIHDAVTLPKYIKKISIDMKKHWKETTGETVKGDFIDVEVDENLNMIKCSGLMIEHINFVDKPPISRQKSDLKVLQFYRYFQDDNTDISTALYIYMQIVAENINKNEIVTIDLVSPNKPSLMDKVKYLLDSLSDIKIEIIKVNPDDLVSGKTVISEADLVIVNSLNEDKAFFESVHNKIPSNIFLISFGDVQRLAGFAPHRTICSIGKGQAKLVLGRWKPRPIPPTTAAVSIRSQNDLEQLKTARDHLQPQSRLLVLSNYPPTPAVMKLVKQWRKEKERNDVYMAMIKNKAGREQDMEDLPNLELAFNVLDHGKWGGEFYIPLREENSNDCDVTLQSKQLGDINCLHWVEAPPLIGTGIPVTVNFAGLSVYDAKRARVEIPLPESSIQGYGMDFSGVTERGERVMGLIANGSASSKVMALPELLWPVPEHWSLEDAATVPMAYVHAFYCLGIKTSIRRGMNILVHGGTGAVGQAALSIALAVGCNVFTTVSDVSKKRFLRQLFPNLPAEHIGNSRDGTFGDIVLNATRGEGCQIIISCVRGELKNITLHCLSHSGTLLDIEQIHSRENFNYGMSHMFRCTSYKSVDFSSMFKYQNYNEMKKIQLMLSEGIRQGYVRPLTRVVFGRTEASRAFRFLAGSRHRGRALLNIKENLTSTQTHSRLVCSPELSHLILCDKGNFGMQLADRLVSRGARKLYIHCQQATPYLKYKMQSWQKLGVKVDLSSSHLSNRESVLALLKHSNRSAPIEGIYIIATEVDGACKPKYSSVLEFLDVESRKLRPSLRYFAVITENDNSFGEEISLDRNQNKLPSVTIKLRNLEKFINENQSDHELIADDSLKCRDALNLIEAALRSKEAVAFASSRPQTQYDLLEEVAKIPGVTINNSTPDETSLEHIGVDSGRAQELSNVLEHKFNITIPKDSLPQMTVAKLKTLQTKTINLLVELNGFDAYFNYIDPDELLATTDIVLMPTLVQSSEMRSDEFDMNQTYLCIVPGMEGHHGRFRLLCERLRLPAAVLQLGLDSINETVTDTARRLVDVMIRKMNMKERFHLLGCEFGVPVVLEMAAILEDHGLRGTVYLLGGTPDDIRSSIDRNLPHSDAELQNSLAQFMHNLMTGNTSVELEKKLLEVSTWEEKVVESLKTLRGHVPYSSYYTQALIKTAYARIQSLRHYAPEIKALRANVILLRAMLPTSLDVNNLQRYSQQPVASYELQASLPYVAKDLRCSTLINNHLEPDVLEAFNNRNNCETYLLNDEEYLVLVSE